MAKRDSNRRVAPVGDETPSGQRDRMLVRVADLEVWREHTDAWRLGLTGVADSNGRIGALTRTVEDIREDVGSSAECRAARDAAGTVHALRRRAWAAVVAAATAIGASGWGLLKSRDENVAAAVRAAERIDRIERELERLRERSLFPLPMRPPP
jgi:hypothetical protein